MALHKLQGISISGIAACVPVDKFNISQYEYFTAAEIRDFKKHVGIECKRYSNGKLTTGDLCLNASEKLIQALNWSRADIGLVVLVTQTPDYTLPATAIILQNRLGLRTNTLALDINLGCSGWIYGLSVVGGLMSSLQIKKGLLLTGETSVIADYKDKSTFPLMGDAGTVTAIELNTKGAMMFDLNSDGGGYNAIIASESAARGLSGVNTAGRCNPYVSLDSQKVLEFCLRQVVPSLEHLMEDLSVQDIDYFVFHQANRIINESLRKKLLIPAEKFPYSIGQFGNTSSASIPLTIVTQLAEAVRHKNLSLLCSGFGVGLSWGSVFLETSNIVCPELIEI